MVFRRGPSWGNCTGLQFPDYYGKNLNALNDCLSDLEIPDRGGVVLVFFAFDSFAEKFPDFAWGLLDIIAGRSRVFSLKGKRLMALAQSVDPKLEMNPIGACPVLWNPDEWLNEKRGVDD